MDAASSLPTDVTQWQAMVRDLRIQLREQAERFQKTIEQQQQTIEQQQQTIEQLHKTIEQQQQTIEQLQTEVTHLKTQLAAARTHRFGRRSERSKRPPKSDSEKPAKSRHKHGRARLPEHLPRRTTVLDLSAQEQLCPCCGQPRQCIGQSETEQLDCEPVQYFVRRTVRKTYACQHCSKDVPAEQRIQTATPSTVGPIDKSLSQNQWLPG